VASIIVGIVTGVLTGLASAILFWWWQALLMKPKLKVSPTVARYILAGDATHRYQFKVINTARRAATNVRITVSARLPGLVREGSTEIIRIQEFDTQWFNKRGASLYRIQPSRMPPEMSTAYLKYFPEPLALAISTGTAVDLIDFLSLRPNSKIRIDVSATDSIAGAAGHARCDYTIEEIKVGRFKGKIGFEHTSVLEQGTQSGAGAELTEPIEGDSDREPAL
jgi:hypothetical protein